MAERPEDTGKSYLIAASAAGGRPGEIAARHRDKPGNWSGRENGAGAQFWLGQAYERANWRAKRKRAYFYDPTAT